MHVPCTLNVSIFIRSSFKMKVTFSKLLKPDHSQCASNKNLLELSPKQKQKPPVIKIKQIRSGLLFNDRERFSGALHVLYSSLVFSIKPQLQALSSRLIVNSPIFCSAKSEVAKLPMQIPQCKYLSLLRLFGYKTVRLVLYRVQNYVQSKEEKWTVFEYQSQL